MAGRRFNRLRAQSDLGASLVFVLVAVSVLAMILGGLSRAIGGGFATNSSFTASGQGQDNSKALTQRALLQGISSFVGGAKQKGNPAKGGSKCFAATSTGGGLGYLDFPVDAPKLRVFCKTYALPAATDGTYVQPNAQPDLSDGIAVSDRMYVCGSGRYFVQGAVTSVNALNFYTDSGCSTPLSSTSTCPQATADNQYEATGTCPGLYVYDAKGGDGTVASGAYGPNTKPVYAESGVAPAAAGLTVDTTVPTAPAAVTPSGMPVVDLAGLGGTANATCVKSTATLQPGLYDDSVTPGASTLLNGIGAGTAHCTNQSSTLDCGSPCTVTPTATSVAVADRSGFVTGDTLSTNGYDYLVTGGTGTTGKGNLSVTPLGAPANAIATATVGSSTALSAVQVSPTVVDPVTVKVTPTVDISSATLTTVQKNITGTTLESINITKYKITAASSTFDVKVSVASHPWVVGDWVYVDINGRSDLSGWRLVTAKGAGDITFQQTGLTAVGDTNVTSSTAFGTPVKFTSASHGFSVGDVIQIAGTNASLNGSYSVVAKGAGDFTVNLDHTLGKPAVATSGTATKKVTTVSVTAANDFTSGNSVTIANSGVAGFNGTFTLASATSSGFTFDLAAAYGGTTLSSSAGTASSSVSRAIVTATAHPLATNDKVTIAATGTGSSTVNGDLIITKVDANTFTYPISSYSGSNISVSGTATRWTTLLSGTTSTARPFSSGTITLSSTGNSAFDGKACTIVSVGSPTANDFTCNLAVAVGAASSASTGSAGVAGSVVTVVTTDPHGLATGYTVKIASAGSPFDAASKSVTVVNDTTFTYTITSSPYARSTTGTVTMLTGPTFATGDLVDGNRACIDAGGTWCSGATATAAAITSMKTTAGSKDVIVTTKTAHGLAVGDSVTLSGLGSSADSLYKGTWSVTGVSSTTVFTFTSTTVASTTGNISLGRSPKAAAAPPLITTITMAPGSYLFDLDTDWAISSAAVTVNAGLLPQSDWFTAKDGTVQKCMSSYDPTVNTTPSAHGVTLAFGSGTGTSNGTALTISTLATTNGSKEVTVTTSTAHGLQVGDSVALSGLGASADSLYKGTWVVTATPSSTKFTFTSGSTAGSTGNVSLGANPKATPLTSTQGGLKWSAGNVTICPRPVDVQANPGDRPVAVYGLATDVTGTVAAVPSYYGLANSTPSVTVSARKTCSYDAAAGSCDVLEVPSTRSTDGTSLSMFGAVLAPTSRVSLTVSPLNDDQVSLYGIVAKNLRVVTKAILVAATPGKAPRGAGKPKQAKDEVRVRFTAYRCYGNDGVAGTGYCGNPVPTATTSPDAGWVPPTLTITSISASGNSVSVTTSKAHGLAVGDSMTVGGKAPSGLRGTYPVDSVSSDGKSLTYTKAGASGSGTSGTVSWLTGSCPPQSTYPWVGCVSVLIDTTTIDNDTGPVYSVVGPFLPPSSECPATPDMTACWKITG